MSEIAHSATGLPRVIDGRYEIDQVLGQGGMGIVYGGHDLETGNPVAVKLLRQELANYEALRKRMLREMRATARIEHPNVVKQLHDGEAETGQPYVVFELVAGDTLKDALRKNGVLPYKDAARIGVGIARGLNAAHEAGVVHRDLKLGNVMLENRPGKKPRVRVLDFGIAYMMRADDEVDQETLTSIGMRMGTPAFMAPEQIEKLGDIDGRADLYALGVLLYVLLAGRVPLEGANPMETAMAQLKETPVRLRKHRADVPRELDEVVMRLLAKKPADRYANGEELAQALLAAAGIPDDATPPPPPRRTPTPTGRAPRRTSDLSVDEPSRAGGFSREQRVLLLVAVGGPLIVVPILLVVGWLMFG